MCLRKTDRFSRISLNPSAVLSAAETTGAQRSGMSGNQIEKARRG